MNEHRASSSTDRGAKLSDPISLYIALTGATHAEIAEAVGVSRPLITGLISGRQKVSPSTAARIAQAIGARRDKCILAYVSEDAHGVLRAVIADIAAIADR